MCHADWSLATNRVKINRIWGEADVICGIYSTITLGRGRVMLS